MTPHETLEAAKAAAREYMNTVHPGRTWFVVGGALRDTDHGRPFKDVDIFVSGYDTDPDPETDDGDRNAYLYRASVTNYGGFTLNVILMRGVWDLQRISERCDFGICQIGWCPETNRTYRSGVYITDVADNTVTLTRSTTPERLVRIQNRFPHFRYRNPRNLPNSSGAWQYVNGEVVKLG